MLDQRGIRKTRGEHAATSITRPSCKSGVLLREISLKAQEMHQSVDRDGRRPRAQPKAPLKELEKRQARRNHVYFLMAAQGNRCIGGGPGVLC